MWFEKLTGFKEKNPNQVRENLSIIGSKIVSKINGASFEYGKLTIPTLGELKNEASALTAFNSRIKITEVVGDVQMMLQEKKNNGAVFQAASQFNLLEMKSPYYTPEHGVDIYEGDFTQGPACAIACGAGTIYRNYFVELKGQIGQSSSKQINCLNELSRAFNNDELDLWRMSNGYALPTSLDSLLNISKQISDKSNTEYEALKDKLRIGIQWNTEVTIGESTNLVTQVYCSALPVSYSPIYTEKWEIFARFILEATYEATFYAALINYKTTKNPDLFLTLVGGGAFGNEFEWIFDAIKKCLIKFKNAPLNIKIVSFGHSNPDVFNLIEEFNNEL